MFATAPWNNPPIYNFASSEFGGIAVKVVGALVILGLGQWLWRKHVKPHFECHVKGCESIGHPVHGTSFRACKLHHPHLDEKGHTVGEIAKAAKEGH